MQTMQTTHSTLSRPPAIAPAYVRKPNTLVRALLRLGVPMGGPMGLLTVRGRTSGRDRRSVSEEGRAQTIENLGSADKVPLEIALLAVDLPCNGVRSVSPMTSVIAVIGRAPR